MGRVMRRCDWQHRLAKYLANRANQEFEWGRNDCALFVAGAYEAMTGRDPVSEYRGYASLKGGMKRLRRAGHADHVDFVASILPEVVPALAMPGDIGVVDGDDGDALCVVQGAYVYAVGPDGLALLPRDELKRAFSV